MTIEPRRRDLLVGALCPPMPTPAFPHDHSSERERRLDVDGTQIPYGHQIVWASMATVLGLPATVAPIGHSEQGLPIGVQIIGPISRTARRSNLPG